MHVEFVYAGIGDFFMVKILRNSKKSSTFAAVTKI